MRGFGLSFLVQTEKQAAMGQAYQLSLTSTKYILSTYVDMYCALCTAKVNTPLRR